MCPQRERLTPAQPDVPHGAAVPLRAHLTRERWMVCQYFRCGMVSSEKQQRSPGALAWTRQAVVPRMSPYAVAS